MGNPKHRPKQEEIDRFHKKRRKAAEELRKRQLALGLVPGHSPSISNRKSEYETVEEEQAARKIAVEEQVKIFRSMLPTLLRRLSRIKDPRNPKTLKHKLNVVMLYGILTFIFQMASRREANREISRPTFKEQLQKVFPELESLPHNDTLNRLLGRIDVNQIEAAHIEQIIRFIRKKKFWRYLVVNCYPIAVDGTQKFTRNTCWSEECLQRQVKDKSEEGSHTQYYVYVLEANLAFRDGMVIPLISEFLSDGEGDQKKNKQDCEINAFKRLAERLKKYFPRLSIMVLLDGLYPNGPIMELCRKYRWQFMIVLQDGSLPSVWEEVEGLKKLEINNHMYRPWGNRQQHFWWVNDIEYCYGENNKKHQIVHVVICEEKWEEVAKDTADIVQKSSRHAWISSEPLTTANVHERCNLAARFRWTVELNILTEKRQGYQYEHCFSYNWQAMKGYHYLMRMGHMINVIAQHTKHLAKMVRDIGTRALVKFLRDTFSGPWLDRLPIRHLLVKTYQIRLE
jgi:hypothetical protein